MFTTRHFVLQVSLRLRLRARRLRGPGRPVGHAHLPVGLALLDGRAQSDLMDVDARARGQAAPEPNRDQAGGDVRP